MVILLVMETDKTFAEDLSDWTKAGLIRLYGKDILNKPEIIAALGMPCLKDAIGLGPKSLREIAEVLFGLGYIDDPDQWLNTKAAN